MLSNHIVIVLSGRDGLPGCNPLFYYFCSFSFLGFGIVGGFGCLRTIIMCIVGKLAWEGSVAVVVGVSDR